MTSSLRRDPCHSSLAAERSPPLQSGQTKVLSPTQCLPAQRTGPAKICLSLNCKFVTAFMYFETRLEATREPWTAQTTYSRGGRVHPLRPSPCSTSRILGVWYTRSRTQVHHPVSAAIHALLAEAEIPHNRESIWDPKHFVYRCCHN